jgi:hypothetical protein
MAYMSDKNIAVYGFCGRKGAGKDTLAKMVLEDNSKFTIMHFADRLKDICAKVFGMDVESFHAVELKEKSMEVAIHIDDYLNNLSNEVGLDLPKLGLVATTPRELLQYVGTDYVRSVCDSYWVDYITRKIESIPKIRRKVIVADVRFDNEVAAIRNIGGKVVKVERELKKSSDAHKSETGVDGIEADFHFMFKENDLSLHRKIATCIAKNRLSFLSTCHWPVLSEAIKKFDSGETKNFGFFVKELGYSNYSHAHRSNNPVFHLMDYYNVKRKSTDSNLRKKHVVVDGIESKRCCDCEEIKGLGFFNKNTRSWDGIHAVCRKCASVSNKKRTNSKVKKDPLGYIYNFAKKSSKYRGITFDLTREQLEAILDEQKGKCFYTGMDMSFEIFRGNYLRMSIDRLDSSKGYTKENVVLTTYRVNIMKGDMSLAEFKDIVSKLYINKVG